MRELVGRTQHPVKGRFGCNILAPIGQDGHDLAGCQVPELLRIGQRQQPLTFHLTEPVLGHLASSRPTVAKGWRTPPTLQGAQAQANGLAGAILACACGDGLIDEHDDLTALCKRGHLSSSSHSARNFFCSTSNAAASASAFSLRTNSRLSFTFSSFNNRDSLLTLVAFVAIQKAVLQLSN